jgi:predicted deacylase
VQAQLPITNPLHLRPGAVTQGALPRLWLDGMPRRRWIRATSTSVVDRHRDVDSWVDATAVAAAIPGTPFAEAVRRVAASLPRRPIAGAVREPVEAVTCA